LNDYGELIAYAREDTDVFTPQVATQPGIKVNFNGHNFVRLAPTLDFVPPTHIQKTIENATQFARMDTRLPFVNILKIVFQQRMGAD
jgi:hypothetical protein